MGFLKSFRDKLTHQDHQDQDSGPSGDQKFVYQAQEQAPEIVGGDHNSTSKRRHLFGPSASSSSPQPNPSAYEPPPGLPPTLSSKPDYPPTDNPPPYEAWLSIPDNSLLPPVPTIPNEVSPANNASASSAEKGHTWCGRYPVYTPSSPSAALLSRTTRLELNLDKPPNLKSRSTITQLSPTSWRVKTVSSQDDVTLTSTLPAYFAAVSNPLLPNSPGVATISFTVEVVSLPDPGYSSSDSVLAMGFASKPYPPFRLPGWHRASLAIHSDDGRRYVNDPYGGIDFTAPFRTGDRITVTLSVSPTPSPVQQYRGPYGDVRPVSTLAKCVTRVQVKKNGDVEGGWDVHEERDGEKDQGIEGLQGESDLYVCVGFCGEVEAVIRFGE